MPSITLEKMLARENCNIKQLVLSPGDYVYLTDESSGPAKKLKSHYQGPFVVRSVLSDHMVHLTDPVSNTAFPKSVHIDRLKPAFVRQPSPMNFFTVSTKAPQITFANSATQTDLFQSPTANEATAEIMSPTTVPLRPKRNVKKPKRFMDSDHVDPMNVSDLSSDSQTAKKVKRVLAQRHTPDGLQYLVHLVGEPAQNAI